MSRRQNKKFFDPTIFQKCWRGVGEQPTFAEQTKFCNLWLPCCNCTFWNFPIRNWVLLWNKLQIQTGQRGNCSTLAGKSRGGTPFCRTLKIVFPKSSFCNVSCETLHLGNQLHPVRQGWGTSPACLGNRNCPWNLDSYYNLLILKAIAILSILS